MKIFVKTAIVAAFLVFSLPAASANCSHHLCNFATDGAYDAIVVGKLVHVASDRELEQVFKWAKAHGYWKQLPSIFAVYQHGVKLVSIKTSAKAAPVTVFMERAEYAAAPLAIGALVRYKPHDPDWEAPKNRAQRRLFYGLTGCVATLCSRTDGRCRHQYQTGVFSTDGQQLNPATGKTAAGGARINPISLRPVSGSSR
jgi:hypothetical protein